MMFSCLGDRAVRITDSGYRRSRSVNSVDISLGFSLRFECLRGVGSGCCWGGALDAWFWPISIILN